MKRKVTLTIEIDPTEHNGVEDTSFGAVSIMIIILRGGNVFSSYGPGTIEVECEGYSEEVDF
jgi:hypothetical protein